MSDDPEYDEGELDIYILDSKRKGSEMKMQSEDFLEVGWSTKENYGISCDWMDGEKGKFLTAWLKTECLNKKRSMLL